jgi:hypothetical protein
MIQKLKAPISVYSLYNHKKRLFSPLFILWEGRRYKVLDLGYHHTFKNGRTLFHVFSVQTSDLYFRLVCDTDNLSWEVEEISDGQAD